MNEVEFELPDAQNGTKEPVGGTLEQEAKEEARLYCVCQRPASADENMIVCETCGEWYHWTCIGMTAEKAAATEDFHCGKCASAARLAEPTEAAPELFCFCRQPYAEDSPPMIQCDACTEWYHLECVDLTPRQAAEIKSYECRTCAKPGAAAAPAKARQAAETGPAGPAPAGERAAARPGSREEPATAAAAAGCTQGNASVPPNSAGNVAPIQTPTTREEPAATTAGTASAPPHAAGNVAPILTTTTPHASSTTSAAHMHDQQLVQFMAGLQQRSYHHHQPLAQQGAVHTAAAHVQVAPMYVYQQAAAGGMAYVPAGVPYHYGHPTLLLQHQQHQQHQQQHQHQRQHE